jgi:lysophospholipase L1-like esterase
VTALAAGLSLALAACGGSGSGRAEPESTPSASATMSPSATSSATVGAAVAGGYAALGDSYSAAPGVPTVDLAAGCLRSSNNYPHLIAAALPAVALTDVTCSAATTTALASSQRTALSLGARVPPQLDAVTSSTRYVTLGIGGNDLGLFTSLIGCLDKGDCRARYGSEAAASIETIGTRVTRALRAIHAKAPAAQVALVGYPQLIPASGTCALLPQDTAELAFVRDLLVALSQRMALAAQAGDAHFVDVLTASEGHDICSADPWVNGPQNSGHAAPFHPFLAEQQAVAELVVQAFS